MSNSSSFETSSWQRQPPQKWNLLEYSLSLSSTCNWPIPDQANLLPNLEGPLNEFNSILKCRRMNWLFTVNFPKSYNWDISDMNSTQWITFKPQLYVAGTNGEKNGSTLLLAVIYAHTNNSYEGAPYPLRLIRKLIQFLKHKILKDSKSQDS